MSKHKLKGFQMVRMMTVVALVAVLKMKTVSFGDKIYKLLDAGLSEG